MQFDWAVVILVRTFAKDLSCLFCHAAIIEHVRDGSVVRALLLPDYYLVTVMLSGIKVRPYSWLCGGYRVCGYSVMDSSTWGLWICCFFLMWAINIDFILVLV